MTARRELDDYLDRLRRGLRRLATARAAAALLGAVLVALIAATAWLLPRGLPATPAAWARALLWSAAALLAYGLLWRPLRRLQGARLAAELEARLPEQQGRIATYLDVVKREAAGEQAPFVELLAEDALQRSARAPIDQVAGSRQLRIVTVIAAVAGVALLTLLATTSPWSYGARYVLLGVTAPVSALPMKRIAVQPGDATVRRNADLTVRAQLQGFIGKSADIFVRFTTDNGERGEWERAGMQADARGQFEFTLYALRAPAEYYIASEGIESAPHAVHVVDAPRIEQARLTYDYPTWTGLTTRQLDQLQDVRTVGETRVTVQVQTDAPLVEPALAIVDAQGETRVPMSSATPSSRNAGSAEFTVTRAGEYRLVAKVANEWVDLTDRYEIEALADQAPTVQIVKPGRDWRASSIEEVPVRVRAEDDYRVQSLALHYSVNGGDWRELKLDAGRQNAETTELLRLEEMGGAAPLTPGDLVTYYATARDRQHKTQTELYMVQVQPFDRRFSEGQGGGGAGGAGGGNEQEEIAERQKEILLATWNLQRSDAAQRRSPEQLRDNAAMLADLQATLEGQTRALLARTNARGGGEADARVKQFTESLQAAADAMSPAAKKLSAFDLPQAIPNEQQALQHLQRAEAVFRDIMVSRQQNGGGMGGGQRGSRDLAELYELEMDLSKNQYETEAQLEQDGAQQGGDDQSRNEMIEKLKELARRQEQLAQQNRQQAPATPEEKWRQAQLRREAEELRKRLQQLAEQQSQQQAARRDAQSSSSSSGSSSSAAQGGEQSGAENREQLSSALNAVDQALRDMRAAEASEQSGSSGSASERSNRRAAEQASRNLRQAVDRIGQPRSDRSLAESVQQLSERAQRVSEQQRTVENQLAQTQGRSGVLDRLQSNGRPDGVDPAQARRIVEAKRQLLEELQAVEREVRDAIQKRRKDAPRTARRLGEIANELDSSYAQPRIERSIVGIERGRANQIAVGEPLITEALENFANQLGEAVPLAEQEARKRTDNVNAEMLSNELAELRRALQERQQQLAQLQNQNASRGQQAQSGAESTRGEGQGQASAQGQSEGSQGAQGGQATGGGAWNDNGTIVGDGREWRGAGAFNDRLRALTTRLNRGELERADLEALRKLALEFRRAPDAMAANALAREDTRKLLQDLEQAALAAAEKSRARAAARTTAPDADDARYRDNVADYYRKLGQGK